MLGIFLALIITILFYVARKVLILRESIGSCIPEGTKTMIPPMIILILAWTLKAMTTGLGASEFVANSIGTASGNCSTSCRRSSLWWAVSSCSPQAHPVEHSASRPRSLSLYSHGQTRPCWSSPSLPVWRVPYAATTALPISDTTIMSSAGAHYNHVNHVSTKLPYAITAACVSFVTYIIAGFVRNAFICLPIGATLMLATLFIIRRVTVKDRVQAEEST